MKKLLSIVVFITVTASTTCFSQSNDPEARIKELGIQLIKPVAPVGNFVKAVRVCNMMYLAGHGPDKPGGGYITGKVGSDLSLEQGKEAARITGISLLSTLKEEIGDLNKVKRIVKVLA